MQLDLQLGLLAVRQPVWLVGLESRSETIDRGRGSPCLGRRHCDRSMVGEAVGTAAVRAVGAIQVELRETAVLLQTARITVVVDIARRMMSFDAPTVAAGVARVMTAGILAVHYSSSSASRDFVIHYLANRLRDRGLAGLAPPSSPSSVLLTISHPLRSHDVPAERQTR